MESSCAFGSRPRDPTLSPIKAQTSPKASHSMVFGPKSLKKNMSHYGLWAQKPYKKKETLRVLRALGVSPKLPKPPPRDFELGSESRHLRESTNVVRAQGLGFRVWSLGFRV